jgi:serine/threonine protein kinase
MPILTENEWLGRTVAERYRLDEILSAGGMGVLFRATDVESGVRVAVKMLKPAFALDQQRVARFLRETRIAGALHCEHVVQVRGIWQDAGVPFLIMELLEGRTLEEELEACGVLSLEKTLAIVVPIANALSAAHRTGIVHRDVKPANIFLCENASGEPLVKLLDFGIAKDEADDFETQTGAVLGTPSYMAPEQAQHGDSGPYTDIWGLGAVIYRCLGGRPPHTGDSSREVLAKVLREPVAPLVVAGVNRLVCSVVDRALSREPHRRYPDVDAFLQALVTAKRRGEAPATELATETLTTEAAWSDTHVEHELDGATSTAASRIPARSLRSIGFLMLGAGLAAAVMALSAPPSAPSILAKSSREHRAFQVRPAPGPPVHLSPALAASSTQQAVSAAKPARPRALRPAARQPPARSLPDEPPGAVPVERDPTSGLIVVTEW